MVFYGFVYLGREIQTYLKLPLPGIVIGMMLFLIFLHLLKQIFPWAFTKLVASGNLMLPFLPLFILPSCVGILAHLQLLQDDGLKIIIALTIGIIATQIITPFIFFLSLKLFKQQ